jgi:multidrug efflux pump subunit AcrB
VGFVFQTGGVTTAAINFGRIAPITVQVLDEDLDEAHDVALRAKDEIENVPGAVDPLVNVRLDYPTLHLEVDRWKAAKLDLTEEDVVKNVITSLNSSVFIHPIVWIDPESGNDYMVGIQDFEESIDSIETLQNVPITGRPGGQPRATLLRNVAPVRRRGGLVQATHWNVLRSIDVYANVEGRDEGSVARAVEERVKSLELPKNAELHVRGAIETLRASFLSYVLALGLATALIYLVLVAQFRSTLLPLVVMATVPFSGMGVFSILFLTGTTYNIQTFLGILMLIGIEISNSVLLVEFADRVHEEGKPPREAIVVAAKTRLRPILMTALATVFALLPMALGIERGSEANVPLARAVVGGLLASVPLTLFFAPAVWVAAMDYTRTTRGTA